MKKYDLEAIDVHAHYGQYLVKDSIQKKILSASLSGVCKRAKASGTSLTIVSPLSAFFPEPGNPIAANTKAIGEIRNRREFLLWIVVNPLAPETFEQAETFIQNDFVAGIKIHPLIHNWPIKQFGTRIFEFATKYKLVIQSHSGQKNCMPEDFVDFANEFPEVKIIISHLGCSDSTSLTLQIKAIMKSKNNNLYTDTSSFRSIFPGLIEMAVKEIGAERILYGTDSPLYFAPCQRARIDHAEISQQDKDLILRKNAINLFGDKIVKRLIKKDICW
ncbi:MAG TPA: amidohydrolase family protein [bacterium]|nr:amidohydrolase family protein [bacterium]HOL35482.1 amidohydrolase family protein [bacterium]HPP08904.1 amidohydrolase family protein [bacterium]